MQSLLSFAKHKELHLRNNKPDNGTYSLPPESSKLSVSRQFPSESKWVTGNSTDLNDFDALCMPEDKNLTNHLRGRKQRRARKMYIRDKVETLSRILRENSQKLFDELVASHLFVRSKLLVTDDKTLNIVRVFVSQLNFEITFFFSTHTIE